MFNNIGKLLKSIGEGMFWIAVVISLFAFIVISMDPIENPLLGIIAAITILIFYIPLSLIVVGVGELIINSQKQTKLLEEIKKIEK